MTQPVTAKPPKRKHWGWRTLGFLLLGFVALFTAQAQGYQTVGTMGCIALSLLGAGYCSHKGYRTMISLEWVSKPDNNND